VSVLNTLNMLDKTTRIETEILKENKGNLRHLWKLFRYVLRSAKVVCAIFISLTVLLSLLRPVLAYIWGRYIDLANAYLPGGEILPMIGLIVAYYVIDFLCNLIHRYTQMWEDIERLDKVQMNRLQEQFHSRVYKKIASLSPEYMEVPKINDMIKRVFDYTQNGWDGMNREVMVNGYMMIAKSVSVASIVATLWLFHPLLALIAFVAPIPTLYTTYVGNKLKFKLIKDHSKLVREFTYYQNLMLGPAAKEIKSFGLHDFFFGKWKRLNDEFTLKEKETQVRGALLGVASNTVSALATAGANVLAIMLMATGRITIGAFGSVISLTGTLISDTSTLFSSAATFVAKKNEAASFFDLMDLPEQRTDGAAVSDIGTIEAKNLRYRYPLTDKYVLDGVNLTIRKGEKVALVGENGAGKTTFVKLLCGMLEPSDGELIIDGVPVEQLNPASRYAAMSAVFQDPARFHTFTVADNVYVGDTARERNEADIDAALAFAGFEGSERNALLGKDIGGTDLSGGQWQKLAIARGWYRNRGFVILDEPTSSLDPLAEADIFRRYVEMARDRTVVMVTHRISVASLCDRVIVFKDGKIVEDGTHDELIGKGGEYARLHAEQSQWYVR